MFVIRPIYIMFVMVCAAVGTLHRSRVVTRGETIDIRRVVVSTLGFFVAWGRGSFLLERVCL
jgi:hypothetical protein